MEGWNPFKKIDMEAGSFLKASSFNKHYKQEDKTKENVKPDKEGNTKQ